MRALLVRGDQRGVSFLEFAVCMALMGIFVSVLLERALYYQEYAEKTSMESTAENIRTGLRFKVADLILADRVSEIQTLADENPLNWLVDRPPNYLGELDSVPADAPKGQWYFDRRNRELVYAVNNQRHFSPSVDRDFRVRYRAMRVSTGASSANAPVAADTWVSLVTVGEYFWFR